jgi:hypothetical protein
MNKLVLPTPTVTPTTTLARLLILQQFILLYEPKLNSYQYNMENNNKFNGAHGKLNENYQANFSYY